jgi:hypothetical protein
MVGTAEDLASPSSDDTELVDPEHRLYQPVSARGPALIVLGIAVFIVILGGIASLLATNSTPSRPRSSVTISGGKVIALTPASLAMKSIVSAGQPPSDIIGNMVVPTGSAYVRTVNTDQGVTQFDRTVHFSTHLSQSQVVDVYRTGLVGLGWKISYHGPQTGGLGTEVLAKHGSSDGFYWEAGVVVSPTTSTGLTPFSVEIFELSDDT